MPPSKDPTEAIRKQASALPDVAQGTSCTQNSFKVGKTSFLFIGPGAKKVGYKAMFKLKDGLDDARTLAGERPDRIEVGSTGWVTARFSAEEPLPKSIWGPWLQESYELSGGGNGGPVIRATKKRATKKKATKKKATKKKASGR